jgi:hypothetical protein
MSALAADDFASKVGSHLDRVSTGSGSDLVKPWESKILGNAAG